MSVSRQSGDPADGYEDYEHELINQVATVTAGQQSGGGTYNTSFNDLEPMGGIDRGEVAELVAFELHHRHVDVTASISNQQAGPGAVKFSGTLRNEPGDDGSTLQDDTDSTGDGQVDQKMNRSNENHVVLDRWRLTWYSDFQDDTNGLGGSPDGSLAKSDYKFLDFREKFGRGPLFDNNDAIHTGWDFITEDFDVEQIESRQDFSLYWVIHEVEDPLAGI